MNGIKKLTAKERDILLEIINSGISWRLSNGSRKSEIQSLKEAKRKLELSPETVRSAYRDERAIIEPEPEPAILKPKPKKAKTTKIKTGKEA